MPRFGHASVMMQNAIRRQKVARRKREQEQKRRHKHNSASSNYIYPLNKQLKPQEEYFGSINHLGMRDGYGYYETPYYCYKGFFKNNRFHGVGIYKEFRYNGNEYHCQWKDNKIDGIGEIIYGGKYYFGYLKENSESGQIAVLRRSRRLAGYPPENYGLKTIKRKRYNKKKVTVCKTIMTNDIDNYLYIGLGITLVCFVLFSLLITI